MTVELERLIARHQFQWFTDSNRRHDPPYYRCACGHVAVTTYEAERFAPPEHHSHVASIINDWLAQRDAKLLSPVRAVIDDLDTARAEGRIYTYGQIQQALRRALP